MRIDALVVVVTLLTAASPLLAETPWQVEWRRQFGTAQVDTAYAVAMDGAGNAYVSGMTGGSLAGPINGSGDVFVAKYGPTGTVLWDEQFGTLGGDDNRHIAAGANGGVYATAFIEPGSSNNWQGGSLLAKFDSAGTPAWTQQTSSLAMEGVTTDSAGAIYVAGVTGLALDGPYAGKGDAVVAKYESDGTPSWVRQFGSDQEDCARRVVVDHMGSMYVSGYTEGILGDGGAGGRDAFLRKYDAAGAAVWTRQLGSEGRDALTSLAVDAEGNAYIAGITPGSLAGFTNAGGDDAYLAKYDTSGTLQWTRQFGTAETEGGVSLALDGAGNPFVSGYTRGRLGEQNFGDADVFLMQYDPMGELLWTTQFGTAGVDYAKSLALSDGVAYISGLYYGAWEAREGDAFLYKLVVPEPACGLLLLSGAIALLRRRR